MPIEHNRYMPVLLAIALGAGIGLLAYILSLSVALSPFGEWLLRLQCQCRKIEKLDPEIVNWIMPIFQEVYDKALKEDNSISPNIKLYFCVDDDENAFAMGRQTVIITTGMLEKFTDAQIKGVFGHEFGHLAHKDTDLLLLVTVGNMFVTLIITLIKLGIVIFGAIIQLMGWIFNAISEDSIVGSVAVLLTKLSGWFMSVCSILFINIFMWIWTQIGNLLVLKAGRENEYEADRFSFMLGYGNELKNFLLSLDNEGETSRLGILISTHPPTSERIRRINELLNEKAMELAKKKEAIAKTASGIVNKMEKAAPVFEEEKEEILTKENIVFKTPATPKKVPRVTAAASAVEPGVQRKICAYCGASIKSTVSFCVKCGMKCD